MWQFLTKNNEDEEYEKMPDFENEQSGKAQPKVTEEAIFDDEFVYAKEQSAKVKQVQQQVPTELSEESFSFVEKLEEEIGEVLLEAKRQAKETISQANQQVATVHEEMEQRLATLTRMKQVAREYQAYCEQMLTIKNESTGTYQQIEQLLAEIKR